MINYLKQLPLQEYLPNLTVILLAVCLGIVLAVLHLFRESKHNGEKIFIFHLTNDEIEDWYRKNDQYKHFNWETSILPPKNKSPDKHCLLQQIIIPDKKIIIYERKVMYVSIENELKRKIQKFTNQTF